jgi:hypothetical protein
MMKNSKNTRLSPLMITLVLAPEKKLSKARKNKATEAIREKGTSL